MSDLSERIQDLREEAAKTRHAAGGWLGAAALNGCGVAHILGEAPSKLGLLELTVVGLGTLLGLYSATDSVLTSVQQGQEIAALEAVQAQYEIESSEATAPPVTA